MELNLIFSVVVYSLVFLLLFCIIKVILDTKRLNNKEKNNCLNLQKALQISNRESEIINNKILLVEGLYKMLFNRVFKITREIVLLQKLIFEKPN